VKYPYYNSFTEFYEKFIIPRDYKKGERLDQRDEHGNPVPGRAPKGNPGTAAIFEYDEKFWDIHLDTVVDPLMVAYKEFNRHHSDPFCQNKTKRKSKDGKSGRCLLLREDLWPPKDDPKITNKGKLMYIFQLKALGSPEHLLC
jgi:hypothetical protein